MTPQKLPDMVLREDARHIADLAVMLSDKAHYWKERATAAEEALSKFAGEIYSRPSYSCECARVCADLLAKMAKNRRDRADESLAMEIDCIAEQIAAAIAKAIEARQGQDGEAGLVHESAVAKPFAQGESS